MYDFGQYMPRTAKQMEQYFDKNLRDEMLKNRYDEWVSSYRLTQYFISVVLILPFVFRQIFNVSRSFTDETKDRNMISIDLQVFFETTQSIVSFVVFFIISTLIDWEYLGDRAKKDNIDLFAVTV
tara:strand:- start:199 stop:573 length:375 start_codon:yes stop_codon:yes gene_type:complete